MKKILGLALLVVAALTLAGCAQAESAIASTIAIDVNPSVVLELDENDKVVNVIMNNEDAVIIVGDMDLIGVDYNVAVNAIIANLVTSVKNDGVQLMDGYFERDFDQVRTYGPTQAEKHTWTFRMLRMEFNTPN